MQLSQSYYIHTVTLYTCISQTKTRTLKFVSYVQLTQCFKSNATNFIVLLKIESILRL